MNFFNSFQAGGNTILNLDFVVVGDLVCKRFRLRGD